METAEVAIAEGHCQRSTRHDGANTFENNEGSSRIVINNMTKTGTPAKQC